MAYNYWEKRKTWAGAGQTGGSGGIIGARGGDIISAPISNRAKGVGDPYGVAKYGQSLDKRQRVLLDRLQNVDDIVTVRKNSVNMTDLSALTAHENVEFAMFTRGSERMVVRGDEGHVYIGSTEAEKLSSQGWRWSGHTHTGDPSIDTTIKLESPGDREILNQFINQTQSVIYDSYGQHKTFEKW